MLGVCLKKQEQNLLSKKVLRRVALNLRLSKNSPRVRKRLNGLTNIFAKFTFLGFVLLFFSGYYPVWDFPPVKSSTVLASDQTQQMQKEEIIAKSFPQPVILPHDGYLSTRFSRFHPGVDIATALGTQVKPITAGKVSAVNMGFWGYGNHVIVSHTNGFKSLYGHMGRVLVKEAQEVTTDTSLGEVGMTGFSSGPHTHLEITHEDRYIDPLLILPEVSSMPKPEHLTKQSHPPLQ